MVFPGGLLAGGGLLVFAYLFVSLPLPDDLAAKPSAVLDARGRQVATLNPSVAQQDVELHSLPLHVPRAVLAAEDRNFYSHVGISPVGVVRALLTNLRAGEVTAGGSTVTQQYIKNAALTRERTLVRKVKEAVLSIKAERQLSKDQILELYLNSAYWGRGANGIDAAARTYFETPAEQLSVNQAATLAGMLQAPEALDPQDDPEQADTRRRTILAGMREEGWIDQATHRELVSSGLPEATPNRGVAPGTNAYYLDAVEKELTDNTDITNPYTGLRIHTALDTRLQRLAQQSIREATADQDYTGALVSVDVASGGVRALVGGPNYTDQPYNFGYRGTNQVGSAFKVPTLAAFIQAGNHPASRFPGPTELSVGRDEAAAADCQQSGEYEPENYGGAGYGSTTVREATASSINTIFVQMELEVGCPEVIEAAHSLGIPRERRGEALLRPTTSLTLGVYDLTPLEMASAFSTLAGEGVARPAHLITRVEGPDGQVLHEPEPPREGAFGRNDSRIVTDVLRDVVESGTGTAAQIGRPVAGKTGTTDDNRDAVFVGYVPQLATAVWVGTPDNSPPETALTGGGVPAETWAAFMEPAVEPLEVIDFVAPDLSGKTIMGAEPASSPPPRSPSSSTSPEPRHTEGAQTEPPGDTPTPKPTDNDPGPTGEPKTTPDSTPQPSPDPTGTQATPAGRPRREGSPGPG